jgi:hypothetical protein
MIPIHDAVTMAMMPEVVSTPPPFNRLPDMTKPDFLWADRFG